MTLYSGLFFFSIITMLMIPAIFLGINGIKIHKYGLVMTIAVILLALFDSKLELQLLVSIVSYGFLLIKIFILINKKYKSRWILRLFILLSILPLISIKILHPFYSNIKLIGISYLTFRLVEIILDLFDGLIKDISLFEFIYFVLFFPTFISGPVDRFRRFREDLNKPMSTDGYIKQCKEGIYKLFLGIGYKYVIASLISSYWLNKIPIERSFINLANYMYSYTFYLFFDFAGYSLMAIGFSYIIGIKVQENFNMPFLSRDVKEFWTRWHISLSTWFRDNIYTRFVMQSIRTKRFQSKYTASYIGYFITMATMGIWHGLTIYYIVYGIYHGLLMIINDYLDRKLKGFKRYKDTLSGRVVCTLITFHLISFGMLIFSGRLFN